MISEHKKEKDKIEKLADQWCRDNDYSIRRSNYKKSQNMSRPYKGTWWGRNKNV
jgi:hypothetical protein